MGKIEYDFSFWFYIPNKSAAIFFTTAFLISTIIHYWQCHHCNYMRVTWLFIACGLIYVVGFGLRILGGFGFDGNLIIFIISVCLIYIVPPLLGLVNYHILGRILTYAPHHSPLPPARVLSGFGLLSLVIEFLNGVGSSFSSNPSASPGTISAGQNMMRASLALQLILNVAFAALAGYFHYKCARAGVGSARGVKQPLLTLYVSVLLILARTVYRVIEHMAMEGIDRDNPVDLDPVVRDEWYFLVFEASLMLLNMLIWNARYPRRYLPADPRVYLSRDGRTELEGPGIDDTHGRAAKIFDPFDVMGMCRGRDKSRTKFLSRESGEQYVPLADR